MAKAIYAWSRRARFGNADRERLERICTALVPDNVGHRPEPVIHTDERCVYAVTRAGDAVHAEGRSLLLGRLYEDAASAWRMPGTPFPDGSYALFRASDDPVAEPAEAPKVEVVTDPAGSRTIWYAMDDETFVASTSQRAIVMFLGSFEFNPGVVPWMLSTGSLGPELSWDRRIQRLQPDASVILETQSWTLKDGPRTRITFSPVEAPAQEHEQAIREALETTVRRLADLPWSQWVLPLSGGYDSRGILCLIRRQLGDVRDLRTLTWGLASSIHERGNDAMIARQLAEAMGVHHDYVHTDLSEEPAERIMNRFVACAEGRTDHFAGYADGLEIWRRLHDEGVQGIIRGDEGFGWVEVTSELGTRLSVEGAVCSDFTNLKDVPQLLGLPPHELPAFLQREEGETLEAWRDRLYHAYRIPTVLAALSDVKLAYVEQITPLVSRCILQAVRRLPDALRTEKGLYKRVVSAIGPDVPYATKGANADPRDILEGQAVADAIRAELADSGARDVLGKEIVSRALAGITVGTPGQSRTSRMRRLKGAIAQRLPRFAKDMMRATVVKPSVGGNTLAFRAYIIARMRRMLADDAGSMPPRVP
jgi:hypothetical protein